MSSPRIIVTGASKGLGLAITRILLSVYNARIIAISRSLPPALSELAHAHDGRIGFVQGDVADDSIPLKAVRMADEMYGGLDGLVLNAGTLDPIGPIADPSHSIRTWQDSFHTNLFSLISMLQHATPYLRGESSLRPPSGSGSFTSLPDAGAEPAEANEEETKGRTSGTSGTRGTVVMVSSGAATGNTSGWGCYNATKAAVNSLCRTYANEEKTISSFSVRPGMVDTGMQAKLRDLGQRGMDPVEFRRFTGAHEEGKLLHPLDPGHVIAGLAARGGEMYHLSGEFLNWNDPSLSRFQRPE